MTTVAGPARHPPPVARERTLPERSDPMYSPYLAMYRFIAGQLGPAERILDLSCGEGYGMPILAAGGATVLGLDIAPEAVLSARTRWTPNGARLAFLIADGTRLPFADASCERSPASCNPAAPTPSRPRTESAPARAASRPTHTTSGNTPRPSSTHSSERSSPGCACSACKILAASTTLNPGAPAHSPCSIESTPSASDASYRDACATSPCAARAPSWPPTSSPGTSRSPMPNLSAPST